MDDNMVLYDESDNRLLHDSSYHPSFDIWRYLFIICACIYSYGLPYVGVAGQVLFGFSQPALFIMSGFLVLRESVQREQRILRTVKKTAICFGILTVSYFLFSFIFERGKTLELIATKKFWLDFLLLNDCAFPVGAPIWFVQSLLYAYLILYAFEKLNLLRFDWVFMIFFFLITIFTGELSKAIGFEFLGHSYLAGNFLTRALPYLLLGCLIFRKMGTLMKINLPFYIFFALFGFLLIVGEWFLLCRTGKLGYYGHMIGMGVVAASACIPIFLIDGRGFGSDVIQYFVHKTRNIIYYVFAPVHYLIEVLAKQFSKEFYQAIRGSLTIVTIVACFLIAIVCHAVFLLYEHTADKKKSTDEDNFTL